MASAEQREAVEKTSTSSLANSASQSSAMEAGSSQSHLHDVRAPELVYNIDEETRMGPETTNDGVTPPSVETAVKEQQSKKMEAAKSVPSPKEDPSSAKPANTFSALSFIASQYAESENSSPRSSCSPAGVPEDGGTNVTSEQPENTGHSSDGFETSSLPPDVTAPSQETPRIQAEEGQISGEKQISEQKKISVEMKIPTKSMDAGGDASPPSLVIRQPEVELDVEPRREPEVSKDGDVSRKVEQAELISDQKVVTNAEKTSDMKEAAVVLEANKDEEKDTDVSITTSKEEKVTGKIDVKTESLTPSVSAGNTREMAEGMMAKDVGESVCEMDSTKNVKERIQALSAVPGDKGMMPAYPEPMDTSEPMDTDDSKEQQGQLGEKMRADNTDLVKEKDTFHYITDTPEEIKPEPDTDSVMSSESTPKPDMPSAMISGCEEQPVADSVNLEEAKTDSRGPGPHMGTDNMTEDSTRGSGMDIVGNEDSMPLPNGNAIITEGAKLISQPDSVVSEESKQASNLDSALSEDSKLAPNADSVMSEDSKLLSNMDSAVEEPEEFFVVKGPSAVVPFGENANSSMPAVGGKSLLEGENSNFSFVDESSQQSNPLADKPSRPKKPRRSSISDIQDSKNEMEDGLHPFPAERVFEYQWPQDGGEWYLLQEQISEYLGILSFKRKYPDLTRRTCDKLEKDFLREKGVVTETQSDLGLTALRSEEVYDLMMKDYPDKYHEYATLLHEREKQKISDKHKEYEVAQPKLEKSKMADYMKKAARSAAEYNRHLLREKREERQAFFDLQTFMIQYPEGRHKKLPPQITKPSAYPVALIPGQFQDHYCRYTSDELRYFPLNTALYDPPKKMSNTLAKPAGSGDSSEDSSEDKSGSSSDSSGSGSSDSEPAASANGAAGGSAKGNNAEANQAVVPSTPAAAALTPGKKSGKKVAKTPAKTPAKSPGKVLKGKRKLDTGKEEKGTSGTVSVSVSTPPVPFASLAAPPGMSKEKMDDDEDKDKCRICKNAVLFLKYKRVETKMIKCSECGKIAHPTCLDLTEKMVQVVTTYPWQCMECKTCVECMDPYDEDKMLFCDRCDRGYHTFCVGLRCLPTGRWECRSCKGVAEAKSKRGRPLKPT